MNLNELNRVATETAIILLHRITACVDDDAAFRHMAENGNIGSELESISNALCTLFKLLADIDKSVCGGYDNG